MSSIKIPVNEVNSDKGDDADGGEEQLLFPKASEGVCIGVEGGLVGVSYGVNGCNTDGYEHEGGGHKYDSEGY